MLSEEGLYGNEQSGETNKGMSNSVSSFFLKRNAVRPVKSHAFFSVSGGSWLTRESGRDTPSGRFRISGKRPCRGRPVTPITCTTGFPFEPINILRTKHKGGVHLQRSHEQPALPTHEQMLNRNIRDWHSASHFERSRPVRPEPFGKLRIDYAKQSRGPARAGKSCTSTSPLTRLRSVRAGSGHTRSLEVYKPHEV